MALRSASLRLPISRALAPAGRRFASTTPAVQIDQNLSAEEAAKAFNPTPLKDPRIPAGTIAYEYPVPSILPDTGFNRRRLAVAAHAHQTTDLWRKISFYICLPAIVLTGLWVYKAEEAHAAHHQHLIDLNGGEEPERKVYSYMNLQVKPYPWGKQSLFFNPKVNIPVAE